MDANLSGMLTVYVGADAGMGAWKLYTKVSRSVSPAAAQLQPTSRVETGSIEFESQVAVDGAERVAHTLGLARSKPPLQIDHNGRSFYVGARAHDFGRPIEALDYERLTGAPEMIALFYGALTRLGEQLAAKDIALEQLNLQLTVGLPFGSVKGDDGKRTIDAVRQWMEGKHAWSANKKDMRATISEVKVATQATGALFDYLLTDDAAFEPSHKQAFKREVGVVSIGFNTVELQVVRNKEELLRFSAGQTVGVRRLLELLNPGRLYSLGELDSQLRAGVLNVDGSLRVWEREVVGFIESIWGEQWKRFEAVLLVGGGAKLLKDSLSARFGSKAYLPDQPVLSIARGLSKLTEMTHRASKKKSDGDNGES